MKISGTFFYHGRLVDGCIEVEDGVIKNISKHGKGKEIKGIIMPAGIDVHVHFRDFKESYKETIESGSLSALYGGICLVVDQPNTNPPVVDVETYFKRMRIAEKTSYIDYALNLGLTEENKNEITDIMSEIEEVYRIPAIGEVFLEHKTMQVSYETLKYVRNITDKLITVHAEDAELITDSRPKEAEIKAVEKCLKIGDFHFCHISTAEALEIIHRSNSTAEVTPHHLLFSSKDTDFRVNPPLRSCEDRIDLIKNIHKADVIASDHAPHTLEEKKEGLPGFPGVEVMYPIFFYMAKKGYIGLDLIVEKLALNPAKIFGFDLYGGIDVGCYANLAVFDPTNETVIKAEKLHSKAGWTIYEGLKAIFPKVVFIRGVKALEDGEVLIDKGFGKTLKNT
jgi:dihydroorotase